MVTIPYHTIPPCVVCPISHVRCHISLVTCHVSHLRCHMSHVFFFFFSFRKWWSSWWRVCYQWGPPHPVFRFFLIKNLLILKSYLFQHVDVRFWSLKEANWWEFNFREIGIRKKCHKLQITARAAAAPCAHFQKLDVAINNFFFQLMLGYFSSGSSVDFSGLNLITRF